LLVVLADWRAKEDWRTSAGRQARLRSAVYHPQQLEIDQAQPHTNSAQKGLSDAGVHIPQELLQQEVHQE